MVSNISDSMHFEDLVKKGLQQCGCSLNPSIRIGVAVSGGADSVSLLISLCRLIRRTGSCENPLYVITVNHNIREESETCGDAAYVQNLCRQLRGEGFKLVCECVEIPRGKVPELSGIRGGGIEDAARFLRYEIFTEFVERHNLEFLCLAHNKNDQLETLLMRFLQGSSGGPAGGIVERRSCFIRPLLDVSRCSIEEYLLNLGVEWRTDSTNFDTDYLRNKIRNRLIPFLDKEFGGWNKAVLKGAEKQRNEADFIDASLNSVFSRVVKSELDEESETRFYYVSVADFVMQHRVMQEKLLYGLCNLTDDVGRIPYDFVEDVIDSVAVCVSSDCSSSSDSGALGDDSFRYVSSGGCSKNEFVKTFGSIKIELKKSKLFFKKSVKTQTDLIIFDIIDGDGIYKINGKTFEVVDSVLYYGNSVVQNLSLPFCVRSALPGDVISCADGKMKKVTDVFSDWHVEDSLRTSIPVIQELSTSEQRLLCILGKSFGFKDWIVK